MVEDPSAEPTIFDPCVIETPIYPKAVVVAQSMSSPFFPSLLAQLSYI